MGKEHSVEAFNRYRSVAIVLLLMALSERTVEAAPILFSAAGVGPASIQTTVDAFRAAVGNPNNANDPGALSGRREINWDGGGTANTPGGTPFNGFQNNRGALFTTEGLGTGFTQSPTGAGGLNQVFNNPTYVDLFTPFSTARVFTPVNSNITDVTFFVPGTNGAVAATVTAFGAVFADVDLPNSTSIQYFDANGVSLGIFNVPNVVGASQTLSFLGVFFNAGEQVSRVRITTGNNILSTANTDTASSDLVVMDDFIYSEPQAVPESSAIILLGAGLIALGFGVVRRWKK